MWIFAPSPCQWLPATLRHCNGRQQAAQAVVMQGFTRSKNRVRGGRSRRGRLGADVSALQHPPYPKTVATSSSREEENKRCLPCLWTPRQTLATDSIRFVQIESSELPPCSNVRLELPCAALMPFTRLGAFKVHSWGEKKQMAAGFSNLD